jgi:hypothetical protein
MFIYVIVNSETLKLYVGQHKGNNLRKYLQTKISDALHQTHLRSRLYASMRKHPKECWSIHPLISGIENRKELDEWERLLIYALKSQHPDVGYNICDGGEGFTGPHTEETKQKLREVHLGNQYCLGQKQSLETIAKRVEKNTGRKRTQEQKDRMSAGRSGKGFGNQNVLLWERTEEQSRKLHEHNVKYWTSERRKEQAERIKKYNLTRRQVVEQQ